jgi:hypothetical protein
VSNFIVKKINKNTETESMHQRVSERVRERKKKTRIGRSIGMSSMSNDEKKVTERQKIK